MLNLTLHDLYELFGDNPDYWPGSVIKSRSDGTYDFEFTYYLYEVKL